MKSILATWAVAAPFLFFACQSGNPDTPAANSTPVVPTQNTVIDSPPPAPDSAFLPLPPQVTMETLIGKIDPAKDTAFVKVSTKYTAKPDIYLRRAAYADFERMHAAALQDGVNLQIVSATRSFAAQKGIWERKWNGQTLVGGKNLTTTVPDPAERATTILRYSSMPATSRHHWGTDIDLNNLENSYFESGTGKKIYDWLTLHAAEYGYCQTYTAIGPERPHGYQEEKWHWSYMPIAAPFLRAYQSQVQYESIKGFLGAEVATKLQVIDHYVGGIAPACKNW